MIKAVVFDLNGVITADPEELAALIRHLRPQHKIGLLSNGSRSGIERVLTDLQMRDLFDAVRGSSESIYAKPEQGIFEEIAGLLQVEPTELLFVDDYPGHVTAAASYGIPSLLYAGPAALERDLKRIIGP